MSQFILDFFFVFIFVMFLTLLYRIKDKTFSENRASYRYTVSGIFVLLGVSILRLIDHQSMFASTPFLSEAIYRDLVEAIGVVAGVTLMIAGVSIWLPGHKKNNKDVKIQLEKYNLIQQIQWEIMEHRNIDSLFNTIPEMICRAFGFNSSVVFRKHSRSGRLICTNHFNLKEELSSILSGYKPKIEKDVDTINRLKNQLKVDYDLKLKIQDDYSAVIYFWSEKRFSLSDNDERLLLSIGRLFSKYLSERMYLTKLEYYENNWKYLQHIKDIIARRNDIEKNLKEFHSLFKNAFGAEFMSLAILDKYRGNYRRYTTGVDSRMLLEDGSHLPIKGTQIDIVTASRKSLLIDDITPFPESKADSLFISCNQKCLMAVPIINYGRITGVLTLGHMKAGFFNRLDLKRVEIMAMGMAPAIEADISRQLVFDRDRYLGAISTFASTVEKSSDIDSLLQTAADVLMDNVKTTMVRVSLLNRDRTVLSTKALNTIRPMDDINSQRVSISKELTRWHNMVMQDSRLLLINQKDKDTSMDKNEAGALTFGGMQSALIIPIVVNGITYGIITLGEMRDWDRFSYDPTTILFCKEIASRIAGGIKLFMMSREVIKTDDREYNLAESIFSRQDILNELKSPITNIRGSLDLLKIKDFGGAKISSMILGSLEDSTNRIISLINEEQTV